MNKEVENLVSWLQFYKMNKSQLDYTGFVNMNVHWERLEYVRHDRMNDQYLQAQNELREMKESI